MSKPIFVVGCQRSGTTWLSNIICRNTEVACIQDNEAGINETGFLESYFFSYVRDNFGNLERDEDFIEFVEAYSASDYFKSSGLDKRIFYRERPNSYPEFFRVLMERYASKKDSSYWLEKTPFHALYLREIKKYFPEARFIAIKRDIVEVVRSLVRKRYYDEEMNAKIKLPKSLLILFGIYHYVEINKFINYFERKSNSIFKINFDDLKGSREGTISNICQFLNLELEPKMLESQFEPNSSFSSNQQKEETLIKREEKFIPFLTKMLKIFPYHFFKLLKPLKMKLIKTYLGYGLPEGFYSIQKSKLNKSS